MEIILIELIKLLIINFYFDYNLFAQNKNLLVGCSLLDKVSIHFSSICPRDEWKSYVAINNMIKIWELIKWMITNIYLWKLLVRSKTYDYAHSFLHEGIHPTFISISLLYHLKKKFMIFLLIFAKYFLFTLFSFVFYKIYFWFLLSNLFIWFYLFYGIHKLLWLALFSSIFSFYEIIS